MKHVDRMRYSKDKLPFALCMLGLSFNVAYFVAMYKNPVPVSDVTTGLDILYNIIFMMIVFLGGEKAKAYVRSWSYVIGSLGIVQFLRVLLLPAHFLRLEQLTPAEHTWLVLFLAASGTSLIIAGIVSHIHSTMLIRHLQSINTPQGEH